MKRCPQYLEGRRNGIKWAVQWLHERADEMNDPKARDVLNTAAWHMGVDGKYLSAADGEKGADNG